ncbi:MAG: hypothetical protein A2174_00435 [Candidatus Portnoybacteria bacterium RBG_13_41_18]|uniref:Uncharacterized protein n=1 Tax=Candidatus Portnoybacteria bacterium RBG_13_41_18 TaxID=1801991 RepID=A0A1G2FAL9_9BACT|nr:MAG: hypothetical protein A2174_00435 [Candidatus Portnoybacteria bacterium RBG_13_41_18]
MIDIKSKRFGLLIFVLTFLLWGYFFVSHPNAALDGNTSQATLSLSPQTGAYNPNDTFSVSVYLNTAGQNVVVAAAYLNYDKVHFQAVNIDTTNSVFTIQAENNIDSTNGVIKITRGNPSASHINSSNALLAVINFKALSGVAPSSDNLTLQFVIGSTLESNVIKDDGLGTDILSGVYNAKYTISGSVGDTTAPTVTIFTIPSTSGGLTVSPISIVATDNVGVVGYIITESAAAPSASASGWSATAPTNYIFSSAGSKTLYAWAKDAAGNVSASKGAIVVISTGAAPACPDSVCNGSETCSTCPQDCGSCVNACGNGLCDGQETNSTCPTDCPAPPGTLANGSLVRAEGDSKVYLIENNQKRWIETLVAFIAAGYSFNNVQVVSASTLAQYQAGPPLTMVDIIASIHANAKLLKISSSPKVYALIKNKLHWIPNPEIFNLYKYQWKNIKTVSAIELSKYKEVKLLKAVSDPRVYYIYTMGRKKWTPSVEVFNSYPNNNWSDILEVLSEEMVFYPDAVLLRVENDPRVYLIEGTTKRWIKTADIFIQRGYKWQDIGLVNQTDLNFYQEGSAIE